MKKHFDGFTLAEVLITLGIIGVVAAMTMPTLINQTNGAQYKAAYKKALSALSQAVTLNVALDDWSFADVDEDNTIKKMLTSRMNVVRDESGRIDEYTNDVPGDKTGKASETTTSFLPAAFAAEDDDTATSGGNTTLFFNDGIMFTYIEPGEGCTKPENQSIYKFTQDNKSSGKCLGYIDVNGLKGPNKVVKCDSNTGTDATPCNVTSPTDIYPVTYFDQSVLPATEAARAVLYGK